jgi:predicted DCC family thiol-disulfide oxidoreductase YuxK
MAHGRALEVWYDGQCPVCRASRDWCAARDPEGRLEFRDVRAVAEAELPVSRADAEASMWVRDADGSLAAGFAGWRRILAELPRWRWLARVSGAAPLRWLGPPAYRLVARARRLLPGYGRETTNGAGRTGDEPPDPSP